ncbi:helix-turn-helix domain-containing protein [Pediococcus pentosaceus]|uniref:helix-turn-helix domain-containing protein n=1 Tax=Pediococcus pentosaceus TaxID=1255 RepID=UPI001C7E1A17|nr:helix-turn-helix transcriptional regulator [Pediococcus pentosaceus]QYY85102.1 helix-turn-helix domain-containing protein [Pediococcus pentosaceus]
MLRNNFSVLIAERQLKITRVAGDTGISRTTLTSLSSNSSKMVQLETVNKLCQYLKINPSDFFEYIPFDFEYYFDDSELSNDFNPFNGMQEQPPVYDATLLIYVTENGNRVDTIELQGYSEDEGSISPSSRMVGISLSPKDEKELVKLHKYTDKLSVAFISDIKQYIKKHISSGLDDSMYVDLLIDFDKTKYSSKIDNKN